MSGRHVLVQEDAVLQASEDKDSKAEMQGTSIGTAEEPKDDDQ
jgi:hypothetical protein